ncbi:MAG: thioredoxin domain-containing protein [Lachnospiraceae bacterium]
MKNHLKDQTSPYLLQHADNPVDWYPWCEEAFLRAKEEDKPIFLSIGYSTCHWCHVMAHESFEDEDIAEILNRYFISIKVDREERPDIDNIYMTVCQAFTGSGGWPTTIFLTPEQKPFFAGTYFPKTSVYGRIGLKELLLQVQERWETNRERLLESAEEITSILQKKALQKSSFPAGRSAFDDQAARLIAHAVAIFKESFDERYGGFGEAPKFPTPHNLLFLMRCYEKNGDRDTLKMVEKTLMQMYRGGMFDHIGGGFCRYSTDPYFLVPHFEKMLYDNALLLSAYCKAFQLTKKDIYLDVAQKTALFILREMTSPEGAFYSAKDADSEGEEGKYYLFQPSEITQVLGESAGKEFNRYFDITESGNFEGKSIPNLLHHMEKAEDGEIFTEQKRMDEYRAAVYEYRSHRYALHLDDKILTSWNALMIAALCSLYRVSGKHIYLDTALQAWTFISTHLCEDDTLYVSYRNGQRGEKGFLDDYAFSIYALLALYEATLDGSWLERATALCKKTVSDFYDEEHGGFFLYGNEHEQLVLRPKETYDGAVFSGNSAMAYDLVRLSYLTDDVWLKKLSKEQLSYMCAEADGYPAGYAMYLLALLDDADEPDRITIVRKDAQDLGGLACRIPLDTEVVIRDQPDKRYPLKNDHTTYYACMDHSCQPPTNDFLTINFRNDTIKQM